MDTGSTLYKKLQRSLERKKKKKNKEASAKRLATMKENQRKRNEATGKGYLSDRQVKAYQKQSEKMKAAYKKEKEKRRRAGYEAYLKRKHAEMRARELEERKEKEKIKKKKEKEKQKEYRRIQKIKAKNKAKRIEKDRKRLLKHPIWIYNQKPYKVYLSLNGHSCKNGNLGRYKTLEEAKDRVKELKKEEENIIFERLSKTYPDGTMELNYEYVIFKDLRNDEAKPIYLKNEYGKYVEHNVYSKGRNYEIVEKCPAKIEDTFWVFGYDPRKDRKTFAWIFNNILNEGFSGPYDMKRIYLYHNKVIFRNDNNEIDIIISKTARDAVRYYNTLQKYSKKGPYLFMGAVTTKSALCESLEKLLVEKTGWEIDKLRRNQHRF